MDFNFQGGSDLPNMIAPLPSWWLKMEIKKINPLLWIKSSPVNIFWCLRCLNNDIDLPYMREPFASSATTSLVAKQELQNYFTTVDEIITTRHILVFVISKQTYKSSQHDRIIYICI